MINRILNKIISILVVISSYTFSQNIKDLQKMKSEYEKMTKKPLVNLNSESDNDDINRAGSPQLSSFQLYSISERDSINKSSKFFGYNFFSKRDSVPFWENLPTPSNYLLGPGDEVVVSLWGETQLRKNYTIDRDGLIYDEKVGILNLMGKSINKAEKYLLAQFSRIYSTLKGSNPSTYINVSLGKLKLVNVNFIGNVLSPGIHPIHPFSDIITGLIQAGGVDTTGSLRKIYLKRDNKIIHELDFYDFLIEGNYSKKIQLRDQDVVFIPPRISTIKIDSTVSKPGIYEAIKNESVEKLIYYAGGLKPSASTKISIQRIIPMKKRTSYENSYQNIYLNYAEAFDTPVYDGDLIFPLSVLSSKMEVEIIGQVKRPGVYRFVNGMKLKDLIDLGGGINDSTFRKSIHLSSAEIVRRDPNTKFEKIIKVDLRKIGIEDSPGNIRLENLDKFVVRSNYNFFKKENIQIIGEVKIPGSYPLLSDSEDLSMLINRSGGLTENAMKNGVSIFRRKKFAGNNTSKKYNNLNIAELETTSDKDQLSNKDERVRVAWQNQKIKLMPGDSIIIKRSTGTVFVQGEVYNPGLIEFQKGKSLNYYINNAGGITNNGDKNKIIVIYANGLVEPKRFLNSPQIYDGSTIIINEKEKKEEVSFFELTSNTLSLISTTLTTIVLVRQTQQ